jgi:hypothetical protein
MAAGKPTSRAKRSKNPIIEVYKQHVDRTLIRENLKLTHQQRLDQLQSLVNGIEELNRAGRGARRAS